MRSDALVMLLTWDRLVPWKVLSLPERVEDEFVPVGYGSNSTVFRGKAKKGSTLWVVTRPLPEGCHPVSLVARIKVRGLYTKENCPEELKSKGVRDLLNIWCSVAVSDPRQSEFFELNDATKALDKLGIDNFRVMRSFPGDGPRVRKAFQDCTKRARNRTVFLSYTHKDGDNKRFAVDLAEALRKKGFSSWLDSLTIPRYVIKRKKSVTSERLSKLIRIGIQRSNLGVLIETENYGKTPWTRKERRWLGEHRAGDKSFRCVKIVKGKDRIRSYDNTFADAPAEDLADEIHDWWKKEAGRERRRAS